MGDGIVIRRYLLIVLFAVLVWPAVAASGLVAAESKATRPNIVLLLADDLGYGELGCQGNPQIPTPYHGVTTMLRRRTLPDGGKGRWTDDKLVLSTHMGHDEPPYDANNPILRGGQPVEEHVLD